MGLPEFQERFNPAQMLAFKKSIQVMKEEDEEAYQEHCDKIEKIEKEFQNNEIIFIIENCFAFHEEFPLYDGEESPRKLPSRMRKQGSLHSLETENTPKDKSSKGIENLLSKKPINIEEIKKKEEEDLFSDIERLLHKKISKPSGEEVDKLNVPNVDKKKKLPTSEDIGIPPPPVNYFSFNYINNVFYVS